MKLWQWNTIGSLAGVIVGGALVLTLTACDSGPIGERDKSDTAQAQQRLIDQQRSRPFPGGTIHHDDLRGVTCWVWSSPQRIEGGMSCLPDWMLDPSQRPPVIDSRCQIDGVGQIDGCRRPSASQQVVSM